MQLTLLLTSPRVAPGLMTAEAWRVIASADRVVASDAGSPLARAVSAAGHRVEVVEAPSGADLVALARDESVVWLTSDDEALALPSALASALVGGAGGDGSASQGDAGPDGSAPQVQVLHASYDVPGARLLDLVTVMDRLRTSCPWDREQTHRSLATYLLEETYETLEAIETGDLAHLREELGDVLLQVVFHARIAQEGGAAGSEAGEGFDIDDVAGGIVEKLVRRHPHVFGSVAVSGVAEVERNWEQLKAEEKGRTSVLDGVPLAMPALALADKVLSRAARAGVEPARSTGPGDGSGDGPGQGSGPGPGQGSGPGLGQGLGERLLDLVAEARREGLDAEQELRDAVRRLAATVRTGEDLRRR